MMHTVTTQCLQWADGTLVHHCLCAGSHFELGLASVYWLSMRLVVLCPEICIINMRL